MTTTGFPEPLVDVRGLNHSFGEGESRAQVLHGNDLEVAPGELVIMTGPSGSGKTTLLTLVGGLRSVQEGSILVSGKELQGLSPVDLVKHRQGVGFIFQHHNLFPALTGVQNVRMALDLSDRTPEEKNALAEEILTRLGLGERMHAKPQFLSGGQKQRVAIARALVHRPRIILADEPTAALDRETSRDVVDLFRILVREENCTVLMVTHDDRIVDVADRIVSMVDGRIVTDLHMKESMQICETLGKIPLFQEYPPAMLMELAREMDRERFSPGSVIVRQGDEGDSFYVVASGTVDVEVEDGGKGEVVATLGEGDFFGEVALVKDEPRNATITATSPVVVYALPREHFIKAIEEGPSFKEQVLGAMLHRTR
jgi:putative ABC transport system ATP-binding protein